MTINTPAGPAEEPAPPVGIIAELVFTASDEVTLRRLTLAVMAVTDGRASLWRSAAEPWQLRVVQSSTVDDAAWRETLKHLIEMY